MASPYALDFNPLVNSIEAQQQLGVAKNRLAMEQERLGMEQERLGFERAYQPLRLKGAELENTSRGLANTREETMLPLDVRAKKNAITESGLGIETKKRELEKGLYGDMAALGQMIESDPDPVSQRAKLAKIYQADPRIRQALANKLPKEVLDDPIAVARYARAVFAGYQAPQVQKVGKDESLVGVVRNPNDPAAPPKIGELYANPNRGEQFKDEHQLRGELSSQPTIKNFSDIKSGYGRMLEGAKLGTGAGDLAVVYGYMKMLDPTSVVREGEFATAEKTAGVPEQIRVMYNKVLNGERLSPAVRDNFLSASHNMYSRALDDVNKIQSQYRDIATRNRLNPANVLLDLGIAKPPADPNAPQAPPFNPPAPSGFRDVINGRGVQKPAQDRLPESPQQPPQQRQTQIPPDAVRALQTDPRLSADFDAKYGTPQNPTPSRQFLMQR